MIPTKFWNRQIRQARCGRFSRPRCSGIECLVTGNDFPGSLLEENLFVLEGMFPLILAETIAEFKIGNLLESAKRDSSLSEQERGLLSVTLSFASIGVKQQFG